MSNPEIHPSNFLVPRDQRVPHTPDFLLTPVGLKSFMRLSLMKGAHAVTNRATHRKSGVAQWRDLRFPHLDAEPTSDKSG